MYVLDAFFYITMSLCHIGFISQKQLEIINYLSINKKLLIYFELKINYQINKVTVKFISLAKYFPFLTFH